MVLHLSKLRCSRRCRVLQLLAAICLGTIYFVLRNRSVHIDKNEIRVDRWLENRTTGCNSHFTGYGNEFALLRFARVDKRRRRFSIPCDNELPKYTFYHGKEGTVLQEWMNNLRRFPHSEMPKFVKSTVDTYTVVVKRIEAHNLYHTLCEWYNVFIVAKLLKLDPKRVNILFVDDRPRSLLDETWDVLFGNVSRYSDLPLDVMFRNLIWNVIGYESPMHSHNLKVLPYADEFYKFFIHSFGADERKTLDCEKLDVTVIWRKDYMTHPERLIETGGRVHRKFQNEDEILQTLKDIFQGHSVTAVTLEKINMKEQVNLFTNTDLLIGMHGAGMSHSMFLPKHAAVFETFPNYWSFLKHFKAFTRWRGIKYLAWQNGDAKNEFANYYTRIPPEVLRTHLQQLKSYLCPA